MASIFKKIRNFLNKDEVRGGLALASAAGGFGAFDGLKYGDALKTTLGGLNLASGLDAGGASGALQAGLGGYGLAQGLGKVGTFGNTYDSLMGNNQQATMNRANRNTFLNTVRGGSGSPQVKVSSLPSLSDGGRLSGQELFSADDPNNTGGLFIPTSGMNTPSSSTAMNNQYLNTAGQVANPNTNMSVDGGLYAANNRMMNNQMNQSMSLASNNLSTGGGQMSNNMSGLRLNPRPDAPSSVQTNNTIDALRQNVGSDYGTGSVSAPGFYPNTGGGNNAPTTFANISFETVFDNIVTKAMKDPLQAVAVGSALVTAFADDPKEEAAKQYAAEMARVRAQTDPNSDFGQNYIQSFADRRTKELDDAYSKATADFVATMSKRGMMDSTIFTEGKASLDARFAELKAKIPMDSQIALQDYQKAQLTNLNLGSQAAYRGGALNAGITNPFSNSFKAAVASTKS